MHYNDDDDDVHKFIFCGRPIVIRCIGVGLGFSWVGSWVHEFAWRWVGSGRVIYFVGFVGSTAIDPRTTLFHRQTAAPAAHGIAGPRGKGMECTPAFRQSGGQRNFSQHHTCTVPLQQFICYSVILVLGKIVMIITVITDCGDHSLSLSALLSSGTVFLLVCYHWTSDLSF